MPRFRPIPLSTAKTAWGLLKDVRKAIKAEPARANMTICQRIYDALDIEYRQQYDQPTPPCGTVGCFAGWIEIKAGTRHGLMCFDASEIVEPLLGESKRELGGTIDYFTVVNTRGDHYYVFNSGEGDDCELTQSGTPAHAAAVIARIDRFMQVNEKALKARTLKTVGRGREKRLVAVEGQD